MKIFLKTATFISVFIILACLFFYPPKILMAPDFLQKSQSKVCFNPPAGGCFLVELAKTSVEMQQGLMYRESLDKNRGMLFIFDKEGYYPFWMKNTLIPLDIIWIDKNKKIVFINENTMPCKEYNCPMIVPPKNASYVLEINSGQAKELNIKEQGTAVFYLH